MKIKQVLYDKKNVIWNKTNKYGGITKIKYDNYYENCGYVVGSLIIVIGSVVLITKIKRVN